MRPGQERPQAHPATGPLSHQCGDERWESASGTPTSVPSLQMHQGREGWSGGGRAGLIQFGGRASRRDVQLGRGEARHLNASPASRHPHSRFYNEKVECSFKVKTIFSQKIIDSLPAFPLELGRGGGNTRRSETSLFPPPIAVPVTKPRAPPLLVSGGLKLGKLAAPTPLSSRCSRGHWEPRGHVWASAARMHGSYACSSAGVLLSERGREQKPGRRTEPRLRGRRSLGLPCSPRSSLAPPCPSEGAPRPPRAPAANPPAAFIRSRGGAPNSAPQLSRTRPTSFPKSHRRAWGHAEQGARKAHVGPRWVLPISHSPFRRGLLLVRLKDMGLTDQGFPRQSDRFWPQVTFAAARDPSRPLSQRAAPSSPDSVTAEEDAAPQPCGRWTATPPSLKGVVRACPHTQVRTQSQRSRLSRATMNPPRQLLTPGGNTVLYGCGN